jgi:electron transfer flavoprotein alpha subunit
VTALCFVELDAGEPIDASLRAVTFARSLPGDGSVIAAVPAMPNTSGAAVPAMPNTSGAAALGSSGAAALGSSGVAALGSFGVADVRAVVFPESNGYAPLAWAKALAQLAEAADALAVVAAGTDHGNEVMAHLGALTGLPMVANCFEASPDGTALRLSRQRWAGSLIEDATLDAPRALLTVATDAVAPAPAPAAANATIQPFEPDLAGADLAVQAIESRDSAGGVSLANARVVVSGGRGIGGVEGFLVVEQLASLLGGAVGVSRAVTSLGWRPHSEQVGQTGTRVSPDLYLACGISGAIQHLAGCQNAKVMVAINTDADAPIMSWADYAIIGDVNAVLPALAEALQARRSSRA